MIFSNVYVHSVHAMCLSQNSAFFVRGFNTIQVSRFLHFKVRYWVRSIYCWNTPGGVDLAICVLQHGEMHFASACFLSYVAAASNMDICLFYGGKY